MDTRCGIILVIFGALFSPLVVARRTSSTNSSSLSTKDAQTLTSKEDAKEEAKPMYELNLNFVLDKKAHASSMHDIVNEPVDILQGLAALGTEALNHRGVRTVHDLAHWKYFKISAALVTLRAGQEPGARDPVSQMNINKALDKEWETKALEDIVNAPVSALSGLTKEDDELFAKVHVKSIADLGTWKYAQWAQAICDLAPFEAELEVAPTEQTEVAAGPTDNSWKACIAYLEQGDKYCRGEIDSGDVNKVLRKGAMGLQLEKGLKCVRAYACAPTCTKDNYQATNCAIEGNSPGGACKHQGTGYRVCIPKM